MALVPNADAGPQTIQQVLSLVFAADRSLVELRQCLCSLERLEGEFQDQQADYVVNYLQASIRSLCLAVTEAQISKLRVLNQALSALHYHHQQHGRVPGLDLELDWIFHVSDSDSWTVSDVSEYSESYFRVSKFISWTGLTHCRETELNARAGPGRASVTSLPLSAESSAAEQLITWMNVSHVTCHMSHMSASQVPHTE